jgi:hypothetical protein
MIGRVRGPLAAALFAAAVVLAGCAQTVDGSGAASSAPAPSGATRTGDFPSSPPSSAPSSGVASTGAASTGGATAAGSGVTVRDPAGHFQVVMPAEPHRTSEPGSFGGYSYTVHIATVQSPYIAIVEGEVIDPALPQDQLDVALRTAVSTFQSSSGLALKSQDQTTYQGHPARSAVLNRGATDYQLLVIGYSGNQTYLLFAPKGDQFDQLIGSFRRI